MTTVRWLPPLLLLAACSTDPTERAADQVEDAAGARAKAMREAAEAQASQLSNSANAIMANVTDTAGYDARVAKTRADALNEEARLIRERGRAQAEATESAGEAEADAVRAR